MIRRLSTRVNVVPVIAKADALTVAELRAMKSCVLRDIERHRLTIYQLPVYEDDDDEQHRFVEDLKVDALCTSLLYGYRCPTLGGGSCICISMQGVSTGAAP